MKVSYDSEDDILCMHFKDGPAEAVKEGEDNGVVELDQRGEVMGIELWGANKKGVLRQLARAAITIRQPPQDKRSVNAVKQNPSQTLNQ